MTGPNSADSHRDGLATEPDLPFTVLDDFAAPLQWSALDPLSAPSTEILLSAVDSAHPQAAAPGAMRADIASGASGHRLQLDIAATDLSAFDDLTLWARSRSRAGTTPGADFLLRLELGSAALPIGAPGNDWHRYLAPLGGNDWHYLRFALDDLPDAVRSALTSVRITVAATSTGHALHLDGLEAQTRRAVGDAETAMLALLDGQLMLNGTPVPAAIPPDTVANPAQPFFRLEPVRSAPSPKRALDAGDRSDFTADGYRLRPAPEPWDLFYAIACEAPSRNEAAQMLDHLSDLFGRHGWLRSGNRAFRVDAVDSATAQPAATADDDRRFVRVSAWVNRGAGSVVVPANDVTLSLDVQAPAADGGAA